MEYDADSDPVGVIEGKKVPQSAWVTGQHGLVATRDYAAPIRFVRLIL